LHDYHGSFEAGLGAAQLRQVSPPNIPLGDYPIDLLESLARRALNEGLGLELRL